MGNVYINAHTFGYIVIGHFFTYTCSHGTVTDWENLPWSSEFQLHWQHSDACPEFGIKPWKHGSILLFVGGAMVWWIFSSWTLTTLPRWDWNGTELVLSEPRSSLNAQSVVNFKWLLPAEKISILLSYSPAGVLSMTPYCTPTAFQSISTPMGCGIVLMS